MTKSFMIVAGTALLAVAVSSVANAASKRTSATADSDVRQILRMMDRDQNGTVSKDEFLQYMSQTYDRLDVNGNQQLESHELRPLASGNWMRCDQLALQRGVTVNERRSSENGPSPWKQFMDSCMAGRVH